MKNRTIFTAILCMLLAYTTVAHQPKIPSGNLTEVTDPEISKAYYSELKGTADHYRITSDKPFKFYVGLLTPDLPGIQNDISAEVSFEPPGEHTEDGGDHQFALLNGTSTEWKKWYEEFGGDNYYQGPEVRGDAEAGTYDIRIYSPDNRGKYVLAVGETEKFTLGDWVNVLLTMPKLKQDYFNKPFYTAYFNLTGLFTLIAIAVSGAAIIATAWVLKKARKKR
jgi:hypothetical protein